MDSDNDKQALWREIQTVGSTKVKLTEYKLENLHTIGAFDISYLPDDAMKGYVTLTLSTYPDMVPYYQESRLSTITEPYISGFLTFREAEVMLNLYRDFCKYRPDITKPELLLIDGCGIYHERDYGLACHIGIELDMPTIGVAKTAVLYPGFEDLKERCESFWQTNPVSTYMPVINKLTGINYGYAYRTQTSKKARYISPGHLITHEQSVEVVSVCRKNPAVDPIWLSDRAGRILCGLLC